MVKINGWTFDFEKMEARKVLSKKWGYEQVRSIRALRYSTSKKETIKVWSDHLKCYCNFFVFPEDHYNNDLLKAYYEYVAEKELLSK